MADANDSDVQKEIHPLTDYPNKAWDRLKVGVWFRKNYIIVNYIYFVAEAS